MLEKYRRRRMNNVLNGLGDLTDPFTFDDSSIIDQPVMPDIPVDDTPTEFAGALPDFPTVDDAPTGAAPAMSNNLDLINKVLTVGGQAYKYVQGRDAQGRTVAIRQPVQQGAGSMVPWIIGAAVLLLLNG